MASGAGDSGDRLLGRDAERAALRQMLDAVRSGESRVLVLRGDAGVGKTALLDYAVRAAPDLRTLRALGVESEMELPFAALHQLCAPALDRLDRLPKPQRDALKTVFGLHEGAPPDRFLVGLAVLSLLSDASRERPLLCVVDDAQWLDRASAQVLGFVARRLMAEQVMLVFGARQLGPELLALPERMLSGLSDADARALLGSVTRSGLDRRIRDRIVMESQGNPLALLELPRGLSSTQLAAGFGLLRADTLPDRIEHSFLTRIEALSPPSRRLLLVAAAEPVGDPALVLRAAERLGVAAVSAAASGASELLAFHERVTFRHPLVRSAVYRAASEPDRRATHLALAEVIDEHTDPDRRAWHLASAAGGPDESVAAELERSAGRAQARGGLAAAAAFLQRSVALTDDSSLRVGRALRASQISLHAGDFERAERMLAAAEVRSSDETQRAQALLLHGQIAFASGHGGDAPPILLSAARKLEAIDPKAARETYLDAWGAALFAGSRAAGDSLLETSVAASNLPPVADPGPADLLLEGLAVLITQGRIPAAPLLRRAMAGFASPDTPVEENFRWGWLTGMPPTVLWDEQAWAANNARQLELARRAGALARLPIDLASQSLVFAWRGEFAAAAAAIAETDAVVEMTDTRLAPFGAMLLAALRGDEVEALALFDSAAEQATKAGDGLALQHSLLARAILLNGLGQYEQALEAARTASEEAPQLFLSAWSLPELIEASVRCGETRLGEEALVQLADAATAADTDWARGVEARSRALLSDDPAAADRYYREAIERLERTRLRPELARAHLLYGEWLRRQGNRVEAGVQLRTAHDLFSTIGMSAFAERTRRELLATGETIRRRTTQASASDTLTAQERQIATLVHDGLSNAEVAARLFLSPRTIEWHLRKVYAKLGITSRRELREVLEGIG